MIRKRSSAIQSANTANTPHPFGCSVIVTTILRAVYWSALCITFVLPLTAQTTSDDWRILERLSIGTPVSVVTQFRRECEFVKITDAELTCDREIGLRTRTLVFARAQISEVRLERPDRNRMIAGVVIGAGIGEMILGLPSLKTSDAEARAFGFFYGAPIGAFIGGVIGRHIHRHGSVLYHR